MRLKRNNRKKTQYRRRVVFIVAFLPICAGVIKTRGLCEACGSSQLCPPRPEGNPAAGGRAAGRKLVWRELFKYPRSVAAGCLAGLSGTGITGFLLWQVFCSWISDAMGRRVSIALTCAIAGVAMSLAGYWNDLFLGGFSVFYLMIMVQQFFGSGSYSIIGPYMAEIWPSRLRASGMGLAYGAGNLGKFIGPAGLALIAGSSNFVSHKRP